MESIKPRWKSLTTAAIIHSNQPLLIYGRPYTTLTEDLWAFLSNAERASAQKMPAEARNTWLWCRATLRKCLGIKLNTDPAGIQFSYNAQGKPALQDQGLHFNVSHTSSSFLIGIAQDPIGVDLESIPEYIDAITADFVLSAPEKQYCKNGENLPAFAQIWTRKEAFLKAIGWGLVDDLTYINVDPCTGNNSIGQRGWGSVSIACPGAEIGAFVGNGAANLAFLLACSSTT
ncbi:MAG: 4'-phosphopantetheinyl transferase superfamily protein [Haliscomenobacter sp.]|uniref:4'-phosphopantetheinyl transferase family protein n=1 Tax=Haliscomenobacter sp. TaxID=2717303 RepID=UPI0029B44284|nr:4'-phosphopantetheinyl transferase superfamily protein [Haliscomenobacter sp.]MDX2070284.1 4'-phosphopantetheinyl transferase superfamily protein [Haliscomenobacter sp.]